MRAGGSPRCWRTRWSVVAVDHQTRDHPGVGVIVDVVHPGEIGDEVLNLIVRTGHPSQHVDHRQQDGDQDSRENANPENRNGGGDGDQELGPRNPARRRNSPTSISRNAA